MNGSPTRTICGVCEKLVDQEGSGIPAWLFYDGEFYHAKCAPQFCKHERSAVIDWESSDSDTVLYRMKCRDCGEYWTDERIGSAVRAEEEAENDDVG